MCSVTDKQPAIYYTCVFGHVGGPGENDPYLITCTLYFDVTSQVKNVEDDSRNS